MKIKQGNREDYVKGTHRKAIAVIECENNYDLIVYQGDITTNDIIIKYDSPLNKNKKLRQPKHIHWVVDLLVKKSNQKRLTIKFVKRIKEYWQKCKGLKSNDCNSLKQVIEDAYKNESISNYSKLDKYGEYPTDFLFVLLILLAEQERTNKGNEAVQFGKVINTLLQKDLDIFSVVNHTEFRSRK